MNYLESDLAHNDNGDKRVPMYQIILRWISVLPVGVLGLFIGMILVNIAVVFFGWYGGENIEETGYYKLAYWLFSPFIGGMLAVFWSAKIAPSYKKIVATVVAGIVLVIDILTTLASISLGEYSLIWLIAYSVSMAIGAGYMMYQVYENENDFEFFNK